MNNTEHTIRGRTFYSGDFGHSHYVTKIAVAHNPDSDQDLGQDYIPVYADENRLSCSILGSEYELRETGLHMMHEEGNQTYVDDYPVEDFEWTCHWI
jgi:hypothetical protein